ncbi:MAG: hypothetical protein M1834_001430 [Cirrosporium novae-zelandiae]|nr:MAG: hypothetical protein M1834_001430 [Cirrosporium novae-zelandiae]
MDRWKFNVHIAKPPPRPSLFVAPDVQEVNSPSTHFNTENGQVFSDFVVAARPIKKQAHWLYRTSAQRNGYQALDTLNSCQHVGVPSLQDLSLLAIAQNANGLSPQLLQYVPLELGLRMWVAIRSKKSDSFLTWQAFVNAYSKEDWRDIKHYYYFLSPYYGSFIRDEFTKLSPPSFKWLTCLTMANDGIPTPELVNISQVKNLVALHIENAEVDERLIRTWRSSIDDNQAFQHLRILVLPWRDALTSKVVEYFTVFPALDHLLFVGPKSILSCSGKISTPYWTENYKIETSELAAKIYNTQRRHRSNICKLLEWTDKHHRDSATGQLANDPQISLPILDFYIKCENSGSDYISACNKNILWFQRTLHKPQQGKRQRSATMQDNPGTGTSRRPAKRAVKSSKALNMESMLNSFSQIPPRKR